MKKTYKVAGHKFNVIMPDGHLAWYELRKYEPFLVENSDNCIFTARMLDFIPNLTDKKLVTVSCLGDDFPKNELYEWNGKWLMTVAPIEKAPVSVYLTIEKDFTDVGFFISDNMKFSLDTVLMLMFALSTACKNTLLMHASVTMHNGKGYIFLGKSGTGKSTHSQLWINNIENCELLNDDNPILRVEDNGEVRVYGSPWSGKTPCYRNLDVPVGAIVDLHQAKKNVIKRQSLPNAYASIYVSFSGYRFIKEQADGFHNTNVKIVSTVPCYSLDCLPNADAAFLCHQTVTQQ